jgi:hypothetical protein
MVLLRIALLPQINSRCDTPVIITTIIVIIVIIVTTVPYFPTKQTKLVYHVERPDQTRPDESKD